MTRENEEGVIATAVFTNLELAKDYIKNHGETNLKFSIYQLGKNNERIPL
jgi:hypothetical protein